MQLFSYSLPPHTGQAYLLTSASLLHSHHAFSTQSLTECAPFLRTYRIPPLRSGSALTQALLCNPCPLPPRSPALPIYFFSKFSFPCGSTGSLKSAFIIEGLSIFGEQVSPEHLKTHFVDFETLRLTWWGFRAPYPRLAYPPDMQFWLPLHSRSVIKHDSTALLAALSSFITGKDLIWQDQKRKRTET